DRMAAPTPFRTLQFGIGGAGVGEYQALYAGPQDPVPLAGDPVAVFDLLFSDFETDPDAAPTTMQLLRAPRQSVLDAVKDSFDATMQRVSTADRQTLELLADKLRELEQHLGHTGDAGDGCAVPVVDLPPGYNHDDAGQDHTSS